MIYKIRTILDVEKDVIRDLIVDSNVTLEALHLEIAKSFGFNGQEMASFYRTDDDWNQGEEIPLFDMSENADGISMQTCKILDALKKQGDKLIYVYDFMSMWTFFVELKEDNSVSEGNLPLISFAFGDVPESAPEKEFKADELDDPFNFDEDDLDNFGEFENIDDYDF